MRQYELSLRRKGALVTLEHAQTYLEKMYGLEDEAHSEAHYLMMVCAKDVIRGGRAYSYTHSFWSSKPKTVPVTEMETMERVERFVRGVFKRIELWRNHYCLTHLVPKQQRSIKGYTHWDCQECVKDYQNQKVSKAEKLKSIATEVKYGI